MIEWKTMGDIVAFDSEKHRIVTIHEVREGDNNSFYALLEIKCKTNRYFRPLSSFAGNFSDCIKWAEDKLSE